MPGAGQLYACRRINVQGCFSGEWIDLSQDHSSTDYGMFMLINNSPAAGNRIVYQDTTAKKDLCSGALFNFSVAIINTDMPSGCQSHQAFRHSNYAWKMFPGILLKKTRLLVFSMQCRHQQDISSAHLGSILQCLQMLTGSL